MQIAGVNALGCWAFGACFKQLCFLWSSLIRAKERESKMVEDKQTRIENVRRYSVDKISTQALDEKGRHHEKLKNKKQNQPLYIGQSHSRYR